MSDNINVNVDTAAIMAAIDERLNGAVNEAVKRLEDKAAVGWVTPDGGTADKGIKSFGDYLIAVRRGDVKRLDAVYGIKALNEEDGSSGGYLVPPEFRTTLLEAADAASFLGALGARGPQRIPMSARTLTFPALDQTVTPTTGNSAMTAGVVTYWTGEAATITNTDPTFANVTLNAHKLSAYTKASMELTADSAIALESLLARLFGTAIAKQREYTFLRGDGVSKPLGVYTAPAALSVTRGTAAATYETADITGMIAKLLPSSKGRAVCVCHPQTPASLSTLDFGSGTVTFSTITGGQSGTLYGLPVYESEFMSAPGTAFDLALIDWTYYLHGDRQQISIAMSEHVNFITDEMTWKVVARMDGQPWLKGSIKLSDGASTTVSPFVYLS